MDGRNGWTRYEKGKITFSLFEEGATFFFMTLLQPLLLLHNTDTTMRLFHVQKYQQPAVAEGWLSIVVVLLSCEQRVELLFYIVFLSGN